MIITSNNYYVIIIINYYYNYTTFVSQGFNKDKVSFARAAFSNLIGGMSYFYGSS